MAEAKRKTRGRKQIGMFANDALKIGNRYTEENDVSYYLGDCLDFLKTVPDASAKLVITSPPYNIGKSYEKKTGLDEYIAGQTLVIEECVRILHLLGRICWRVRDYVDKSGIIPFDTTLFLIFADCRHVHYHVRPSVR